MIYEYTTTTGGDLALGDGWYGGPDEIALFVLRGVLDVIVLEQMLEDQAQRVDLRAGALPIRAMVRRSAMVVEYGPVSLVLLLEHNANTVG